MYYSERKPKTKTGEGGGGAGNEASQFFFVLVLVSPVTGADPEIEESWGGHIYIYLELQHA